MIITLSLLLVNTNITLKNDTTPMPLSTHERSATQTATQEVKQTLFKTFPEPNQKTYLDLLADINPERAAFLSEHITGPEFKNPNELIRLIESHLIAELVDAVTSPQRLAGKLRENPTPIRQPIRSNETASRQNITHAYPQPPPRLLRTP